ncbi:hypothetical protein F5J12DRAFT_784699 [Pisolithus orientalis]|uniref:uncharacterized protein n=1 Tax=Pisolithus orientalis TaxID=936130 RepID=UPI002224BDD1|nr:uncharacterized protein F5J12DRAFT_784699 [Pisolithus orientalis]KAI5999362.1 hypothetical protein F5J12DRAFT_784699 [Pisolithus orientalis]
MKILLILTCFVNKVNVHEDDLPLIMIWTQQLDPPLQQTWDQHLSLQCYGPWLWILSQQLVLWVQMTQWMVHVDVQFVSFILIHCAAVEPEADINVDDIRVEYHLNASKPTVMVPFTEFS